MDSPRLSVRFDGLEDPEFDPDFGPSEGWGGGHGLDFGTGDPLVYDFDLDGLGHEFGDVFGADYSSQSELLKQAQTKINALGYSPALKPDGIWGPKTAAGVSWARAKFGLSAGGLDDGAIRALGITPSAADVAAGASDPIKKPSRAVAIATMAKALRQAGSELGHPIDDTLLSLMLGQMLGAEGAMPGLWNGAGYTLRGTNNIGAAQVPGGAVGKAFALAKKAIAGWGAYAHKDSNPGGDEYIGWYYIAPNVLEAARHWLTGFAGTANVLKQNPRTPQDYATIMYRSGYYTGLTKDADKEIAGYAKRIAGGMPPASVMNGPSNDPSALSVDPSEFASIESRKVTSALFDKAKAGKSGGAWSFLLPPSFDDLVKTNGVVWFGPAPAIVQTLAAMSILGTTTPETLKRVAMWVGGGAVVGGVIGGFPGILVGAVVGGVLDLIVKQGK